MLSAVEQIKQKLSIVEVIGTYVKLEKAGANYKARCPFHNERTPSFFVSPPRESFHCFGCGKGGDIFTFVEEVEGIDFREALKVLAERAGVTLDNRIAAATGSQAKMREALEESLKFYRDELARSKEAREYLNSRGVTGDSIEEFAIGFAPAGWRNLAAYLQAKKIDHSAAERAGLLMKGDKGYYDRFRGRLMFPFFDYSGRVIGYSGRVVPGIVGEESASMGKYINSPETPLFLKSRIFYGLYQAKNAIREADKAILVEGQLDVIMAHQAGTKNVIGASGTALTGEHIDALSRLTDNITVLLDADEAGFRASERSVRLTLSKGLYVNVVALPAGKDPAACVQESPEIWRSALATEQPFIDFALSTIREIFAGEKEIARALREFLYPHIDSMYSEIEKDKALQRVSSILSISGEGARRDFEKWQARRQKGVPEPKTVEEEVLPPGLNMISRRLYAISELLRSRNEKTSAEEIEQVVQGFAPLNLSSDERQNLLFEAETYYPEGRDLKVEIAELTRRLERESYREKFEEAMRELRKAEREGNEAKAKEWLAKCQEISKHINL